MVDCASADTAPIDADPQALREVCTQTGVVTSAVTQCGLKANKPSTKEKLRFRTETVSHTVERSTGEMAASCSIANRSGAGHAQVCGDTVSPASPRWRFVLCCV